MMHLHTCKDGGEIVLGGLGVRPVVLSTGQTVQPHTHHFDHVTFFASGRAILRLDGEAQEVSGGSFVLVKAASVHEVEALTDDVKFWCVFPEYDANGHRHAHFMGDIP